MSLEGLSKLWKEGNVESRGGLVRLEDELFVLLISSDAFQLQFKDSHVLLPHSFSKSLRLIEESIASLENVTLFNSVVLAERVEDVLLVVHDLDGALVAGVVEADDAILN